MQLHHTQVKAANKFGVKLFHNGTHWVMEDPKTTSRVSNSDPKVLLEFANMLRVAGAQLPSIRVFERDNTYVWTMGSGPVVEFFELGWCPMRTELLNAGGTFLPMLKASLVSSAPKTPSSPSVVPSVDSETPSTPRGRKAPDAVARVLASLDLVDSDGAFDHGRFLAILELNGVEVDHTSKWACMPGNANASDTTWVGRYRMIGGQKLRVALRKSGATAIETGDGPVPLED